MQPTESHKFLIAFKLNSRLGLTCANCAMPKCTRTPGSDFLAIKILIRQVWSSGKDKKLKKPHFSFQYGSMGIQAHFPQSNILFCRGSIFCKCSWCIFLLEKIDVFFGQRFPRLGRFCLRIFLLLLDTRTETIYPPVRAGDRSGASLTSAPEAGSEHFQPFLCRSTKSGIISIIKPKSKFGPHS